MSPHYEELLASISVLEKERVCCHLECFTARWSHHGRNRIYDDVLHTQDCYGISKELIRFLDIHEFVINPDTYDPGNIMRQVVSGRYNLRKRKRRPDREEHFSVSVR